MSFVAKVVKDERERNKGEKECDNEILRLLGGTLKSSLNTERRENIKLVILLLRREPIKYANQIKEFADVLVRNLAPGDKEWIEEFASAHIYKLPD